MTRLESVIIPILESDQSSKCYWWDGTWYTRKDMLSLVAKCEDVLKRAGFSRGQRLVVMVRNSPLIPALSLAVWRLGGVFCPLNEKAGLESLTGTLELIRPFAVVAEHDIPELSSVWPFVTCELGGMLPEFTGRTQTEESTGLAIIFATSGTTGLPKAVPLTHNNIYSNCIAVKEMIYSLSGDDVILNVLPNFHSFGYTVTIILPMILGAKTAIVPAFLPPAPTIRALDEAKVDVIFAVPAIVSFLMMNVEKEKLAPEVLSRIRLIITGGDKLNINLHTMAKKLLGLDNVMEGYGLTETSPVVCVNHDCETQKIGSIGTVIPGYEYKLKDREGKDTTDSEGVLWVKGASVTPGYLHAPEITAERFDSDGYFNTGDYVNIDSEGYVFIIDRVTDIIIVGGFNVYPQEVERVLSEHPDVQTAVVVGMPHEINGEIPKAYIQLKDGAQATDRDIIRFAKERLAHFKVPRSVEFVEEFPLSGTGKILRRVLRERAKS